MNLPKRKPNRLKNYDYSSDGIYFVTCCVQNRLPILWEGLEWTVKNPTVYPEILEAREKGAAGDKIAHSQREWKLSEYGKKVENAILNITTIYPQIQLDAYTIMPNHVHLLFSLKNTENKKATASNIICQLKGAVTKQIGYSIWQKLFHDHVVRNSEEYIRIKRYIQNNPMNWEKDCFYIQDDEQIR